MNKFLNHIDQLAISKLYMPLVLFGALLAAQIQYIQHGWINPDTILYFESAKLIAQGEWQAAVKVFNWPLYSICIAGVHKLTSLSIHTSAQLLSVLFFGITTFSFLKIIELAGGTARNLCTGALILFSSQYLVGGVLEMLMRDQGFWAFYLSSLVFFIRFYQSKAYKHAFLWQICAIIATLFRIEAISFLVLLPITLLFNPRETWQQRIKHFVKCNFLNITAAISILAAIIIKNMSMSQFGRLKEVFTTNLLTELTHKFLTHAQIMSDLVLGKYLEEFAVQGLVLTFIYVMISKAITASGLINLGLAAFTYRTKNPLINIQVYQVLKAAIIIASLNMALIITKVFVLSGRYVVALGLIVMILASFTLADLLKYLNSATTTKEKKLKWLTIAILIFMLLGIVKNIMPKSEGYNYMQDAAAWVKLHNKENKAVFYDDSRIRYFLNEPFTGTWNDNWKVVENAIENKSIKNHEILIISQSKKRPKQEELVAEKLPEYAEVKRFNQAKGVKSLVIYKRKEPVKKSV